MEINTTAFNNNVSFIPIFIVKKTFTIPNRFFYYTEVTLFFKSWNPSLPVLTKTRNDIRGPETTYNVQEATWNDLQRERNDMKQPTASKNDVKRATTSKKRPETT